MGRRLSRERVGDLLAEGEELLWCASRWRGLGPHLLERWYLGPLALLLFLRTVARLLLAYGRAETQTGAPPSWQETAATLVTSYAALDVALVLGAGWFLWEAFGLMQIHYLVTPKRVGSTHFSGAFWLDGAPEYTVAHGSRRVTFDWGKQAGTLTLWGEPLDDPTPWRLRFVLPTDEEAALTDVLESRRAKPPAAQ